MVKKIGLILEMIKFSHTVFALPFAIIAAFLAANAGRGGFCGFQKLLLIVLCMVFARSVAMTFNRIADAHFDARNPRTLDRAIPTGKVSPRHAWLFLLTCATAFIAVTFLFWQPLGPWFGFGNYWPFIFALPVLIFVCLYSFTKRFTWLSHFWLGAALMAAPLGTWIAISPPHGPAVTTVPIVLGSAVLVWVAGFDIIYACQDFEIDLRDGLFSLPAIIGKSPSLWVSRLCHSLTITFLLILAQLAHLGKIYLAAVLATALLLIIEHLLVQRNHVKAAFDLNGIVSILLAAAVIVDVMSR
ncbi:MAG: UbiA family prenyltransferase [Sedimentisphaerales bacterium]|nr:UbiA family prenyltransferase [Sedimentisphaerales bacterium]